jgi:inosine-uridine nucleoside N-ribohydrolase
MSRLAAGGRLVPLLVAAALIVAACGVSPQPSESPDAAQRSPRPIIIDTDLDVSDIAAVAVLLLDPSLDVRALTIAPTGTGVTTCASGRAVARYVLEQLGASSVPYACGRSDPGPDGLPFPPEWRTAADTGWGIDMPLQAQSDVPEAATDLLARAVAGSPTPPWIVALGPWTNLEDAVAADPSILERVAGIHAMAGAVDAPGNVFVEGFGAEDRLEWNVAADPSAFNAVFDTDVALSIVPLDATEDVPVRQELLDRLADAGDVAGANFAYELMLRVPSRIGEGQQLWDELAALAFADPELVNWEDMSLSSTAEGRLDRADDGRTVRVAMSADLDAAESALLASLGRGPNRPTPFALTGKVAVSWDGTACVTNQDDGLAAGVARVTFENQSGAPAGVTVVGVTPPHAWDELPALLDGLDMEEVEGPPDWVVEAVSLADETGEGGERTGTVAIGHGSTYGPICITGQWPDLEFTPGEPIAVAP